jgi:hypothetical protein
LRAMCVTNSAARMGKYVSFSQTSSLSIVLMFDFTGFSVFMSLCLPLLCALH